MRENKVPNCFPSMHPMTRTEDIKERQKERDRGSRCQTGPSTFPHGHMGARRPYRSDLATHRTLTTETAVDIIGGVGGKSVGWRGSKDVRLNEEMDKVRMDGTNSITQEPSNQVDNTATNKPKDAPAAFYCSRISISR